VLTGHREEHGWVVQHPTHDPVPDTQRFQDLLRTALSRTYDARVLLDAPPFGLSWGDV
jgi:hypothetical protein